MLPWMWMCSLICNMQQRGCTAAEEALALWQTQMRYIISGLRGTMYCLEATAGLEVWPQSL